MKERDGRSVKNGGGEKSKDDGKRIGRDEMYTVTQPQSTPLTKISMRKAMDCTVLPSPISSARIQFCLAYQLKRSQLRPSLW